MSPRRTEPVSGSWSVASVRIRVDLPAPLGPSRPNIPGPTVRVTSRSAWTPLGYLFERFSMTRFMRPWRTPDRQTDFHPEASPAPGIARLRAQPPDPRGRPRKRAGARHRPGLYLPHG